MNAHDQNYMKPEEKKLFSCKECGEISEGEYCSKECFEASEL